MKSCLSLHYIGANSYLFVNGAEIHKSKGGDTEINPIPLCLGNISKYFSVGNVKQAAFYGNASIQVDDKLDIHKCLV